MRRKTKARGEDPEPASEEKIDVEGFALKKIKSQSFRDLEKK